MRLYKPYCISILFVFLSTLSGFAQIQEIPLPANPQLILQANSWLNPDLSSVSQEEFTRQSNSFSCVVPGATIDVCLPFSTGGNGTVSCLNCDQLSFGTTSSNGDCVSYTADGGTSFGIDSISLEWCDSNAICTVYDFLAVLSRKSVYEVEAAQTLAPETDIVFEPDTSNLPSPYFRTNQLFSCQDPALAIAFIQGNDFHYQSKRFAGRDTACAVVFDRFCVADTFVYPFLLTQDTIDIPIFEDFYYDGPYPNKELWLDDRVFVNQTLAGDAPSIGVASFDGTDSSGKPYEIDYGESDHLTSAYFDLSAVSDQLYLSFWLQPKGRSFYPEFRDSLVLQFKQPDGIWVSIASFEGPGFIPIDTVPEFTFHQFFVNSFYHYKGFQFRFINYSDNTGLNSVWNLDYLRLEEELQVPDGAVDDLAFTAIPSTVIGPYSSMPWYQFRADINAWVLQSNPYRLRSLSDITLPLQDSRVFIGDANVGANNLLSPTYTLLDPQSIPEFSLLLGEKDLATINNGAELINVVDGFSNDFPADGDIDILHQYFIRSTNQDQSFDGFIENDTVRAITSFRDFYAYDDGSAESAILIPKRLSGVAQKFSCSLPDTLRAVQIMFPHLYSPIEDELINIRIWLGDLDSEPAYERFLVPIAQASSFFDTIQGYTTYVLTDEFGSLNTPLAIPAGDFYVGLQLESSPADGIFIGFDKNNPAGRNVGYANNGTGWEAFSEVDGINFGAMMIRALMQGSAPKETTTGINNLGEDAMFFNLYPNPATQYVDIILHEKAANQNCRFDMLDGTGQRLKSLSGNGRVDLGAYPGGVYFVVGTNLETGEILTRKFILQP